MTQPPHIVRALLHAATALEDSETAELAEQVDAFYNLLATFDAERKLASTQPERRRWITALYETEERELEIAAVIWQLRDAARRPELLATLMTRVVADLEQRLFPGKLGVDVLFTDPEELTKGLD